MAARPMALSRAFTLALAIAIMAVAFTGLSPQNSDDDSALGEVSLLQLEGRFDADEASFIQVSDTVNIRSRSEQKAVAKNKVHSTARPHLIDGMHTIQFGSHTHPRHPVQAIFASFVEMGRNAGAAADRLRSGGDAMIALTIVIFVVCGVALTVIFCKLYSEHHSAREDEEYLTKTRFKRDGHPKHGVPLRDGAMYGEPRSQSPGLPYQRPSPADQYRRTPEQYQHPAEQYPRSSTEQRRPPHPHSSSPQLAASLPATAPQPAGGQSYGFDSSEQLPDSTRSSPLTPTKLSSELHGAIVPAKRKFVVKIPPLLMTFPPNQEISRKYSVHTKDDIEMLNLKVLRHKPNPHESPEVHIEEYMTLSMPPELDKELVVCTFGRVAGHRLTCEIYKSDPQSGSKLYGVLQEAEESAMSSEGSTQTFALWLATEPAVKLLSILVVGKLSERRVKIVDGRNPTQEVASTVPAGAGDRLYETECYPHSDVLLVVLALAGVDRMVANTGSA